MQAKVSHGQSCGLLSAAITPCSVLLHGLLILHWTTLGTDILTYVSCSQFVTAVALLSDSSGPRYGLGSSTKHFPWPAPLHSGKTVFKFSDVQHCTSSAYYPLSGWARLGTVPTPAGWIHVQPQMLFYTNIASLSLSKDSQIPPMKLENNCNVANVLERGGCTGADSVCDYRTNWEHKYVLLLKSWVGLPFLHVDLLSKEIPLVTCHPSK